MGTYVDIFGTVNIPQDKLPELVERMLTVAQQGGMMDAIQTERFTKTITLLRPIEMEDGCIDCIYNYFENDFWENAGFNIKTGQMYSNKIGNRDFHAVIVAMYVLQEFYSTAPCITHVDGRPFDTTEYIGWLNHLLGEQYSDTHRVPGDSTPIAPVSSEQFLRTTSDERTYFWQEGGDVVFTPAMCRWLNELQKEYSEILSHLASIPSDYAKTFIAALVQAEKECHLFFFAPVFDEFITHTHLPKVQAAIILLTKLLDEYMPGGKYLDRDGWVWNTSYSRFNDDFRAYAIKLYYAVLANLPLRNKVFGF